MCKLQIATYNQARRLIALGFDWTDKCGYYFDDGRFYETKPIAPEHRIVPAPSIPLTLKWMRDVKNIQNGVSYIESLDMKRLYYYGDYQSIVFTNEETENFDTYEEAESELLTTLLTLIEQSK